MQTDKQIINLVLRTRIYAYSLRTGIKAARNLIWISLNIVLLILCLSYQTICISIRSRICLKYLLSHYVQISQFPDRGRNMKFATFLVGIFLVVLMATANVRAIQNTYIFETPFLCFTLFSNILISGGCSAATIRSNKELFRQGRISFDT